MLTITVEAAQKAVRQVLTMFGEDYAYSDEPAACQYAFEADRPGCLVGWIIWLIDKPTFEAIRTGTINNGLSKSNYASITSLAGAGYLEFETEDLLTAFLITQGAQDAAIEWGISASAILELTP